MNTNSCCVSTAVRVLLLWICISLPVHADLLTDTSTTITLRNAYIDRDYKQSDAAVSRMGGWTQGADIQIKSGYTEGLVNFGVDLADQYAYRLDGGGGRGPDTIIPYSATKKEQAQDYGHASATLKAKLAGTVLKVGEFRPRLPIASTDDTRQLMTTFSGWQIESNDIDKLWLIGGRYDRIVGRNSSNREPVSLGSSVVSQHSDGLSFLGGTYTPSTNVAASYFFGQLEGIYQQHYLGLSFNSDLGAGYNLKSDLRYYANKDAGRTIYGRIDNHTYGAMTTLRKNGHALGFGFQRMLGATGFPLLNGYAAAPFLVNWSPTAFAKAGERSWQVRYDYDCSAIGVPGLRFMSRIIKGAGIERVGLTNEGSEEEATTLINYTVQNGNFKGLGFEWRHIIQSMSYAAGGASRVHYDENRLITTYTLSF